MGCSGRVGGETARGRERELVPAHHSPSPSFTQEGARASGGHRMEPEQVAAASLQP